MLIPFTRDTDPRNVRPTATPSNRADIATINRRQGRRFHRFRPYLQTFLILFRYFCRNLLAEKVRQLRINATEYVSCRFSLLSAASSDFQFKPAARRSSDCPVCAQAMSKDWKDWPKPAASRPGNFLVCPLLWTAYDWPEKRSVRDLQ